MFGFRKKQQANPDNQVPYQVYETLQQPNDRRRLWLVRLGASLVVVTLLILGGVALSNWLLNDDEPQTASGTSDGNNRQENQNDGSGDGNGRGNSPAPAGQSSDRQPAPSPSPATPAQQPPSALQQSPQQGSALPSTGSDDEPEGSQANGTNSSAIPKPQ